MPKTILFLLALTVVILTGFLTVVMNLTSTKSLSRREIETAVNQAKHLYRQEKERGRDFSEGPCLSNALMPGWVVDIAHNPRLPIDDLLTNQCSTYLEGRAQHFVELDTEGSLIRTK